MTKKGIVMETHTNKVCIMTDEGEFVEVKAKGKLPAIGSVYSNTIYKKIPVYKYISTAACLLFFILLGTQAYAYYTPVASVLININPALELKINKWDRIIKIIPVNADGKTILSSINIKNKSLDDGLDIILGEAEKENFIDIKYIDSDNIITVNIKNKNDKPLDLPKFEEHADKKNLKFKIITNNKPTKTNNIKNEKLNNKINTKTTHNIDENKNKKTTIEKINKKSNSKPKKENNKLKNDSKNYDTINKDSSNVENRSPKNNINNNSINNNSPKNKISNTKDKSYKNPKTITNGNSNKKSPKNNSKKIKNINLTQKK